MWKILLAICLVALSCPAFADVKIRDIAKVEGIGDQQISGYGLVVGLNATGDQTAFTAQSFSDALARMGVTVTPADLASRSVAAVIVTAKLPSFARSGQTLDVTLSVIGNAKSLAGGTLLMTPLYLPEGGEPYATAQGPLSIGGTTGGATIKSHLTVARIPSGATIARSTDNQMDTTKFDLAFSSLGNVVNAKTAINSYMGTDIAKVTSPSSVTVEIPAHLQNSYYDFLNTVLNLEIQPETFAKVVMEERTGTVVMGADVRISTVAVSYGNMTITIASSAELPEARGADAVDTQGRVMMVPEGATVSDLVKALNSMGVAPGDMISIFQAIKAAGALHAELEVI